MYSSNLCPYVYNMYVDNRSITNCNGHRRPKSPVTPLTNTSGYSDPIYPVLFEDAVKMYKKKDFAVLPCLSKFMVKERLPGLSKVQLVLKTSSTET